MPGDAVHVKWAYRIGFVTALTLYVVFNINIEHIILMFVIYMFATKFMSPDIDLDSEPYQRWGILKLLISIFKDNVKHRSKWSHGWILGWITINVYITIVFAIIVAILNFIWLPAIEPAIDIGQAFVTRVVTLNMTSTDWLAVGVVYACTFYAHIGHVLVDKVFTGDRKA
jgi:uncharacterized metal-binding protein